jgi:hypothetical protein
MLEPHSYLPQGYMESGYSYSLWFYEQEFIESWPISFLEIPGSYVKNGGGSYVKSGGGVRKTRSTLRVLYIGNFRG